MQCRTIDTGSTAVATTCIQAMIIRVGRLATICLLGELEAMGMDHTIHKGY